MGRLRLALLLLAVGIALPATLIVLRATESLELENAYRHETVAERVFDEMERSLSDFLLREAARPPGDYDRLPRRGAEATASAAQRVAGFARDDAPFVLGWFALDGDAAPRLLPAREDDAARLAAALRSMRARRAGPAPTDEALEAEGLAEAKAMDGDARAQALREAGGVYGSTKDARPRAAAALDTEEARRQEAAPEKPALDPRSPAPGRTRALGRKRSAPLEAEDADVAPEAELDDDAGAYALLQRLNRAGALRSERQSKARTAPESAAPTPERADALGSTGSSAALDAPEPSDAPALPGTRALLDATGASETSAQRPVVDPFIGRAAPDDALVLTRSVWRGDGAERQGVVLDRGALADWLRAQVLRDPVLARHATLVFDPERDDPTLDASSATPDHRYLHRFAEPFEPLVARLDLAPLPGLETGRSLVALGGLLALALGLGLLAVERTSRVALEYAQRRSDFVAAVSHELKTPLTSIRLYAEMLRDGLVASDAKRDEYHATITDEAERLSRLIDNVLELSRLDDRRRAFDRETGGLAETVRGAVEKLHAHAERAGFALSLDCAPMLPRVAYDRDAVTQIVFNLTDNALKYAREADSKRVVVGLAPTAEGDGVALSVRDFGPGVPEDQLGRIFEPFYRIGDELTRTAAGTGIGLALVRDLARGMGGRVRAERPPGGGLAVVVTIPAEPDSAEPEAGARSGDLG